MSKLNNEIESILNSRSHAVLTKDRNLFSSLQLQEIPGSGIEGYLRTEKLQSELLYAIVDDQESNHIVALVREKYWHNGSFSHKCYLMFHFLRQNNGELKISNIAGCLPDGSISTTTWFGG